jgi:acyl-CoA synthetase (NDP forming)
VRVAFSMQSGSLGASLLQLATDLQMGISWFVSLGDKSDISGNDLLQFWEDDESTAVVAMYTESFGNPRKFARLARRVGRHRPIVAVRTGAAAIGSAADALYQQAGLIEVPTVRVMLDVARVLASQPVPAGPRVAILSNARSPGVLATAAVEAAGLVSVPPPHPLDWRSTTAQFADAIAEALGDESIDAILVIHAPPLAAAATPAAEIDQAAQGSAKPVLAVMLGGSDGPLLPGSSVPAFSFPEPAAAVLGRMWAYGRWRSTEADATVLELDGLDPSLAADVLDRAAAHIDSSVVLELTDAEALLGAYGVRLPRGCVLHSPSTEELLAAAHDLGYPVVLKSTHRRVGRSARAGIALDLADDHALLGAAEMIRSSLGADAESLLVQQMAAPGVDVHIHCTTDERLGPVVNLDLGSLQATTASDSASRLAPLSAAAAEALIETSRVGRALDAAGLYRAALIDTIGRVAQLMIDHPALAEIDINPAIVSTEGCVATDARIVVHDHRPLPFPLRRLG